MKKLILFVCGHNAGRSQMAEAYFNHWNTDKNFLAISCGTHPSEEMNPVVKKILQEENIETKNLYPKKITPEMEKNSEKIFTMGCGVNCAIFSGEKKVIDLGLDDPHGEEEETVRKIFQELKICIQKIIQNLH